MTHNKLPLFKVYSLISSGVCIYPEANPTIEIMNTPWPLRVSSCPHAGPCPRKPAIISQPPQVSVPFLELYARGIREYAFFYGQASFLNPRNGCGEILYYGFASTSLMRNVVENLFMDLLVICVSALEKCLFRYLVHFIIEVFVLFSYYWILRVLYIFWVQVLWYWLANIFSQIIAFSFHSLLTEGFLSSCHWIYQLVLKGILLLVTYLRSLI